MCMCMCVFYCAKWSDGPYIKLIFFIRTMEFWPILDFLKFSCTSTGASKIVFYCMRYCVTYQMTRYPEEVEPYGSYLVSSFLPIRIIDYLCDAGYQSAQYTEEVEPSYLVSSFRPIQINNRFLFFLTWPFFPWPFFLRPLLRVPSWCVLEAMMWMWMWSGNIDLFPFLVLYLARNWHILILNFKWIGSGCAKISTHENIKVRFF